MTFRRISPSALRAVCEKDGIRFTTPHVLRPTKQVSGHDLTGAPNKPGFGLLGWLERLARDERSESRAAKSRRKIDLEGSFPAPQAHAQRSGARSKAFCYATIDRHV
jgi:hypothetical protein